LNTVENRKTFEKFTWEIGLDVEAMFHMGGRSLSGWTKFTLLLATPLDSKCDEILDLDGFRTAWLSQEEPWRHGIIRHA